jgi:hypothetical protein
MHKTITYSCFTIEGTSRNATYRDWNLLLSCQVYSPFSRYFVFQFGLYMQSYLHPQYRSLQILTVFILRFLVRALPLLLSYVSMVTYNMCFQEATDRLVVYREQDKRMLAQFWLLTKNVAHQTGK